MVCFIDTLRKYFCWILSFPKLIKIQMDVINAWANSWQLTIIIAALSFFYNLTLHLPSNLSHSPCKLPSQSVNGLSCLVKKTLKSVTKSKPKKSIFHCLLCVHPASSIVFAKWQIQIKSWKKEGWGRRMLNNKKGWMDSVKIALNAAYLHYTFSSSPMISCISIIIVIFNSPHSFMSLFLISPLSRWIAK